MRTIDLRLGSGLRAVEHAADLAAARTADRGTLDGTITSIQVGEHGVLVRLRACGADDTRTQPAVAAP